MKKALKIIALVMATALTLAMFAGCGEKEKEDNKANDTNNEKTYVIYSDNAFAPFEYLDKDSKEYVGLDMDLLAAIAEDQGFKYEMHNEGFDASMGAVQSGQADAMIAGMTIKPDREKTFDFSEGYFKDGQILVLPEDSKIASLDELKDKTVAVKTSTAGAEYAASIKDKYGFKLNYYEGSNEMYQAVLTGTDAACFEDYSVIAYSIKQGSVKLKTSGEVVNPGFYGFAVKKGQNSELIELFNKGLANLKSNGKYSEILAKYGYNAD